MDFLHNLWGFFKEYSGIFASIPALFYLINLFILKYIKKDELVLQKDLNIQLENKKKSFNIELENVKKDLNKELEKEKANLNANLEKIKAQYTQENEKLKSELSHQNSRLLTAYSGVYKDQVDALSTLYEQLLKYQTAIQERKSDSNDSEKTIQPLQILDTFQKIYYSKGIFIPKSLDEKIKNIMSFCLTQHFSMYYLQAEQAAKNGDLTKANQLSEQEIKNALKLQELRDAFRDEIRKILAID